MNRSKEIRPYGAWESTITSDWIRQRLKFEDVRWTLDGNGIIWVENRSGQNILVYLPMNGPRRDLFVESSARGGVLYGGGEFGLSREAVYFVNRGAQLFRRMFDDGNLDAITPQSGALGAPTPSPDGNWIVYVSSDGKEDMLALADATGASPNVPLARGADFYMQPVWHPDGKSLAWVEWDHPNMPWDATRVMLARLNGSPPSIMDQTVVAGGGKENLTQPQFSPDGRWLSFITSSGNWEALALFEPASGKKCLLLEGENLLLSSPAWVQGIRTTAWSSTSERIYAIRNEAGRASLLSINVENGSTVKIDTKPYTWLKQISANPVKDELVLIASSPQTPEQVVRWDGKNWISLAKSDPQEKLPEEFSASQELRWQNGDGTWLHSYYFPPKNPRFSAEGAPPIIVNIHGGPTHQVRLDFPKEAPYFTSRGFGWLEVSYRGCIGFGRAYQDALNARWGELDLEDVASGVEEAVRRGLADGSRVALFGGSAGGLTVLNALARYPGRFRAGICLYPVTNMLDPGLTSDKFESHFMDRLVGILPGAEQIYKDRSPLYQADKITDPVAIFHGSADTAVPLSQSQQIADSLRSRGVPVLLQVYEGEGHGFRSAENLADCYRQMEGFLRDWV